MNKVILITGASSGIGEGIARELGKAGAKVFLGARRLERIHALADEIRSAGGEAEAQVLDVTSRQSMAAFVEAAREKWGRIDVLINNAGIMPLSPLSAGKQDEWERTIDVNIKGVLWGIGAVLPIMEAQNSGRSLILARSVPCPSCPRPQFIVRPNLRSGPFPMVCVRKVQTSA